MPTLGWKMHSIRLLLAESDEYEDVFAVDPAFTSTGANATREWAEALTFTSMEDAHSWVEAHPHPSFHVCQITVDVAYLN